MPNTVPGSFMSLFQVFLVWMSLRESVLDRPDPTCWVIPLRFSLALSPARRRILTLLFPWLAGEGQTLNVVLSPANFARASFREMLHATATLSTTPRVLRAVWKHVFHVTESAVREQLRSPPNYPIHMVFKMFIARTEFSDERTFVKRLEALMAAQLAAIPTDPVAREGMNEEVVAELEDAILAAIHGADPAMALVFDA